MELLRKQGFEIVIAEFMNQPNLGRDKRRYAIVARRNRSEKSGVPDIRHAAFCCVAKNSLELITQREEGYVRIKSQVGLES
ncbi:hypothetical protein EV677_0193 [Herminiimonas fonticola]|uniref:Uncharacterized protein n=1 Tax=Herminiimonas fonticola TaxID=303380 RepID=A0A4R6GFP6_9BURK|nr:hypothetical protein Hfont_0179 [Herminiimonas fonticola]TDN93663.1 hypothetical protein EV677_0193 [Herminiimonas fonticola]